LRLPDLAADHIVEGWRDGEVRELQKCEFINVESEFAAMSVAIGASAAGPAPTLRPRARAAVHGRGVFNASGLGLPIVMTVANRAIGAPINI